jgi:hypothetical protein
MNKKENACYANGSRLRLALTLLPSSLKYCCEVLTKIPLSVIGDFWIATIDFLLKHFAILALMQARFLCMLFSFFQWIIENHKNKKKHWFSKYITSLVIKRWLSSYGIIQLLLYRCTQGGSLHGNVYLFMPQSKWSISLNDVNRFVCAS